MAPWLSSTTTTSKLKRVQLEAARVIAGLVRSTTVEAVLAEVHQSCISSRFQTICLQKADEWAHLPPADDRRHTLCTPCKQRLKRKDWRTILLLSLTQNDLNPQVFLLTANPVGSYPSPMGQASHHANNHHTTRHENVTIPAERPFASNSCLHYPVGHPHLHRWFVS